MALAISVSASAADMALGTAFLPQAASMVGALSLAWSALQMLALSNPTLLLALALVTAAAMAALPAAFRIGALGMRRLHGRLFLPADERKTEAKLEHLKTYARGKKNFETTLAMLQEWNTILLENPDLGPDELQRILVLADEIMPLCALTPELIASNGNGGKVDDLRAVTATAFASDAAFLLLRRTARQTKARQERVLENLRRDLAASGQEKALDWLEGPQAVRPENLERVRTALDPHRLPSFQTPLLELEAGHEWLSRLLNLSAYFHFLRQGMDQIHDMRILSGYYVNELVFDKLLARFYGIPGFRAVSSVLEAGLRFPFALEPGTRVAAGTLRQVAPEIVKLGNALRHGTYPEDLHQEVQARIKNIRNDLREEVPATPLGWIWHYLRRVFGRLWSFLGLVVAFSVLFPNFSLAAIIGVAVGAGFAVILHWLTIFGGLLAERLAARRRARALLELNEETRALYPDLHRGDGRASLSRMRRFYEDLCAQEKAAPSHDILVFVIKEDKDEQEIRKLLQDSKGKLWFEDRPLVFIRSSYPNGMAYMEARYKLQEMLKNEDFYDTYPTLKARKKALGQAWDPCRLRCLYILDHPTRAQEMDAPSGPTAAVLANVLRLGQRGENALERALANGHQTLRALAQGAPEAGGDAVIHVEDVFQGPILVDPSNDITLVSVSKPLEEADGFDILLFDQKGKAMDLWSAPHEEGALQDLFEKAGRHKTMSSRRVNVFTGIMVFRFYNPDLPAFLSEAYEKMKVLDFSRDPKIRITQNFLIPMIKLLGRGLDAFYSYSGILSKYHRNGTRTGVRGLLDFIEEKLGKPSAESEYVGSTNSAGLEHKAFQSLRIGTSASVETSHVGLDRGSEKFSSSVRPPSKRWTVRRLVGTVVAAVSIALAGWFGQGHIHAAFPSAPVPIVVNLPTGTNVAATPWQTPVPAFTNAGNLNLRASPGTDPQVAILAVLPEGAELLIQGQTNDPVSGYLWYQATWRDGNNQPVQGWVAADFVDVLESVDNVARVVNTPGSVLRLREGPGQGYGIKARLPHNTALIVTARTQDGSWFRVRADVDGDGTYEAEGYVAASYTQTAASHSQPQTNVAPVLSPGGASLPNAGVVSPSLSPVQTGVSAAVVSIVEVADRPATVNARIELRRGGLTDQFPIISFLQQGQRVTVTAEVRSQDGDLLGYQVTADIPGMGRVLDGFVPVGAVTLDATESSQGRGAPIIPGGPLETSVGVLTLGVVWTTQGRGRVRSRNGRGPIKVRKGNSLTDEVLFEIPEGTLLDILGDTEGESRGIPCYRIQYQGRQGYVPVDGVELINSLKSLSKKVDSPEGPVVLRAGPNRTAKEIALLPHGTPILVTGHTGDKSWYRIEADIDRDGEYEIEGFVAREREVSPPSRLSQTILQPWVASQPSGKFNRPEGLALWSQPRLDQNGLGRLPHGTPIRVKGMVTQNGIRWYWVEADLDGDGVYETQGYAAPSSLENAQPVVSPEQEEKPENLPVAPKAVTSAKASVEVLKEGVFIKPWVYAAGAALMFLSMCNLWIISAPQLLPFMAAAGVLVMVVGKRSPAAALWLIPVLLVAGLPVGLLASGFAVDMAGLGLLGPPAALFGWTLALPFLSAAFRGAASHRKIPSADKSGFSGDPRGSDAGKGVLNVDRPVDPPVSFPPEAMYRLVKLAIPSPRISPKIEAVRVQCEPAPSPLDVRLTQAAVIRALFSAMDVAPSSHGRQKLMPKAVLSRLQGYLTDQEASSAISIAKLEKDVDLLFRYAGEVHGRGLILTAPSAETPEALRRAQEQEVQSLVALAMGVTTDPAALQAWVDRAYNRTRDMASNNRPGRFWKKMREAVARTWFFLVALGQRPMAHVYHVPLAVGEDGALAWDDTDPRSAALRNALKKSAEEAASLEAEKRPKALSQIVIVADLPDGVSEENARRFLEKTIHRTLGSKEVSVLAASRIAAQDGRLNARRLAETLRGSSGGALPALEIVTLYGDRWEISGLPGALVTLWVLDTMGALLRANESVTKDVEKLRYVEVQA